MVLVKWLGYDCKQDSWIPRRFDTEFEMEDLGNKYPEYENLGVEELQDQVDTLRN